MSRLSRWCVLTKNYLFTFKEQRKYESPTEVIHLPDILVIKKSDEVTHREFSFVPAPLFIKSRAARTVFSWWRVATLSGRSGWVRSVAVGLVRGGDAEVQGEAGVVELILGRK